MAFLCTTCGKSFWSKDILHFHNQIHSQKNFTCKIGDETLVGTKSFNNHIKIHQTFECNLCHSSVKMNSRTTHMRTCSNQESKKFKCSECPYIVDRQDRLKTPHQSVIFDFKTNFDFLYEEFNLPMTLKIHVIIHHYSEYFQWTGKTMKYTNA